MKLNKKFLASFMAMTMAAAPMSAYADDLYTVTGTGTITILETEIYNVVLPTNESLDFKVDPFGVLTLDGNETLETVVSEAAGTVTSSATAVINKSSMPLDVTMEFYFSQEGTNIASNAAVSLGSLEAVESGEAELYLEVLPFSGATLQAEPVTNAAITPEAIGLPVSDKAVSLTSAATALSFSSLGTELSTKAIEATGEATTSSGTAINFVLQDVAYAYDVITGAGTKAGTVTAAAVLSEDVIGYDYRNVYAFAIQGCASPKAKDKWLAIHDADSELKLMVKFTLAEPVTYTEAYTHAAGTSVYVAKAPFSGTASPNPGFVNATITNATVNGVSVTTTITSGYVTFQTSAMTSPINNNVIIFTSDDGNTYKAIY